MTKEQVALIREEVQETISKILIKTSGLPEEDGTGDVTYLLELRALLETLADKTTEDEYVDSYYDSGCYYGYELD